MQEGNHTEQSFDAALLVDWGISSVVGVCEQCDWVFLAPNSQLPERCPNCFSGKLAALEASEIQPLAEMMRMPELFLPFTVDAAVLQRQIEMFLVGLKFPPDDLTSDRLLQRLTWLYLPMWLVDSRVQAAWQAETGFNYQVKSHQESYGDWAGWKSQEVMETRQRWEPRIGKLERGYHNIAAPALENHSQLIRTVGNFLLEKATAFSAELAFAKHQGQVCLVRLPDRSQQDAWPDAVPSLQALAAEECRQACGADFIREFRWSPEFGGQNWTLLLLPVLTTFYMDDDNQPQKILFHGQDGKLVGTRRASMRRARGIALTILMVALLFFVLSLCVGVIGAFNPLLLPVAGFGLFISLVIALGAIYPVAVVWSINR